MEASSATHVNISSVVPASLTGENKPRYLTAMDLAVKLHYVQAVYFFNFTIPDLKNITFPLLDLLCNNFNFSLDQIDRLKAKYASRNQSFSEVEILYALIWRSILKIRGETDTNVITICDRKMSSTCWNDDLVISVVERKDDTIAISELAGLIAGGKREENGVIKRMIEQDKGCSDFITYGANLTFVNLGMVNLYQEFEIKGEEPDFVNYTINGVGDNGVVLVFPKGELARIVSVVMPAEELPKLKVEVNNMIM